MCVCVCVQIGRNSEQKYRKIKSRAAQFMRCAVKQDNPNNFCYTNHLSPVGLLHFTIHESQELHRNIAKFKLCLAAGVFFNFPNFLSATSIET